jgi:hypothetical protein
MKFVAFVAVVLAGAVLVVGCGGSSATPKTAVSPEAVAQAFASNGMKGNLATVKIHCSLDPGSDPEPLYGVGSLVPKTHSDEMVYTMVYKTPGQASKCVAALTKPQNIVLLGGIATDQTPKITKVGDTTWKVFYPTAFDNSERNGSYITVYANGPGVMIGTGVTKPQSDDANTLLGKIADQIVQ